MMLRKLARPLLASVFISGGIDEFRKPSGPAQAAKPLVDNTVAKQADALPEQVPTDPESVVRLDGAVKIIGGTLLASGRFSRPGALLLMGSLVPTTIAGHPFWQYQDAEQRNEQLAHFLKNASMLGGLLLAFVDTGGRPSLGWRARRAMHKANEQAQDAADAARLGVHDARRRTTDSTVHAAKQAKKALSR
ncbi:MAG: DoxX family membrane protein [Pseudonocardiaceae bacterium]|nr:DoxX family membrane protein [Pseudonocardiaceae bacterium]